jgi:hypothetical protein
MCILIVSCSVFFNWLCWARGNFSGEPGHVHIRVCVSLRCVGRRAGTSIFGHFAGVGGGTVRVFCVLGSVLACAVRLNRWGWWDSTDFSGFPGSVLAGMVRLKWWGGSVFKFSLSSVCC